MMTSLAPLESSLHALLPVSVAPELDGRSGTNRALAPALCQISAANDAAAIAVWLAEFAHSPHTFRSYRKEAIRLLCWSTRVRRKAVSSLTREDVLAYEAFLEGPTPASVLDNPSGLGDELAHAASLSATSQRHAMGIVRSLFTYLVNAGYLAGNPWTLRRRKRTPRVRQVERYLDQAQWTAVLDFLETLPQTLRRERQHYERVRWVMRFLHDTALRVSEAAQARGNDFVRRRGKWWLRVLGKGGVCGEVPIRDKLMAEFARYRTFHDLPPTPSALETTPVILSIAGRADDCLTPTAIYLIVKEAFTQAADALAASDPVTAAVLRRASTHWLRHYLASRTMEGNVSNSAELIGNRRSGGARPRLATLHSFPGATDR